MASTWHAVHLCSCLHSHNYYQAHSEIQLITEMKQIWKLRELLVEVLFGNEYNNK